MAWRHTSSVLRYPLTVFAEGTDYIQIDVQKYTPVRKKTITKNFEMVPTMVGPYLDPKKAIQDKKVYGEETTSYGSFANDPKTKFRKNSYRQSEATILLPMPSNIQDGNAVSYSEDQMNSIAAAAVGGVTSLLDDTGKKEREGISLTERFTETAKDAGIDGTIASKLATKYFAAQAVNVFGGNVTVNQLLARQQGQIFNPNMELLFNGPTLRSFRFSFKMTPRNREEANQVQTIIRTFKKNMAPKTTEKAAFLETPNVFELTYRKGSSAHPFLHKFKQCFLENIGVNYTSDGTYATYGDGTPTSMTMDLTFKELEPVYDIDYDDDGLGVGY